MQPGEKVAALQPQDSLRSFPSDWSSIVTPTILSGHVTTSSLSGLARRLL